MPELRVESVPEPGEPREPYDVVIVSSGVKLRTGIVACIGLALAGARLSLPAGRTATVFLADVSSSVDEHKAAIEDYVNTQITKNMARGDSVSVVEFAGDAGVVSPFSAERREIHLGGDEDTGFTNVEKALRLVRGLFPPGTNKRLVLISDGIENAGRATDVWRRLDDDGVNKVWLRLRPDRSNDVQVAAVGTPSALYAGETVPVEVKLKSSFATSGKVSLVLGGRNLVEKAVRVQAGTNIVTLNVTWPSRLRFVRSRPSMERTHSVCWDSQM